MSAEHVESSIALVRALESMHDTSGVPQPPPLFRDANQQPLVGKEHVEEVQTLVAGEIARLAAESGFLERAQLPLLLACWNAWGDRDRLKQWGRQVIENPKTCAQLLAGFLPEPTPRMALPGGVAPGQEVPRSYYLDPDWFSMFVEPSNLVGLARELSGNAKLGERERDAVEALLNTYDEQVAERDRNPFRIW